MVSELGIDAAAWTARGTSALNTTFYTIMIILILCIIGFGAWFLINFISYNKTVIVRDMVDKGELIRKYRAKQYLDDKKVYWWKLWGEKDKLKRFIPQPPDSSIGITATGKLFVELKRTSDGHCIFLKDNSKIAQYPTELLKKVPEKLTSIEDTKEREEAIQEWKQKTFDDWKVTNKIDFTFQPLSTSQRTMMVSELRKAEERRGSSIWQNLPQIVGIVSLVIIVVCLFIFWGDIAQPAIEGKQLTRQMLEIQGENLRIIQEVRQDVQTLMTDQAVSRGTTPREQAPD